MEAAHRVAGLVQRVAGGADRHQVVELLAERQLDRHPGVDAAEHGGKGVLVAPVQADLQPVALPDELQAHRPPGVVRRGRLPPAGGHEIGEHLVPGDQAVGCLFRSPRPPPLVLVFGEGVGRVEAIHELHDRLAGRRHAGASAALPTTARVLGHGSMLRAGTRPPRGNGERRIILTPLTAEPKGLADRPPANHSRADWTIPARA